MSKHTIAVVLSVLVVAVLAGLSVHSYDNYKHNQQVKAAYTAQLAQKAEQEQEAKAAAHQQAIAVANQCIQAKQAYTLLPASTKAKTPTPACSTTPLQ